MSTQEVILNNYADDSKSKEYINNVLMPRVFHDIPLNILNTGEFSIINEYMSQALENLAFTSAFYFNESFITKAVLADSIYSEAAIFNIGYSFAIPSSCQFLFELKLSDIYNNAVLNVDSGFYELIIDKNTKFNLSNGNIYSLDYDILIQFKNKEANAFNIQYTNMDQLNSIAINKNRYILYRVTSNWLCLFINASEFERTTYTVVNNVSNGIPNEDYLITCNNHICGFDVKYIDTEGNEQWIPHDHLLAMHDKVKDNEPYLHYIMDNPQTIRFMFQLNGNKYFVPKINSSFEIIVYTCHGEAANFTDYNNEESQPSTITSTNRFPNNANILKVSFVLPGGSIGGTNIGSIESVRRETIEAYNTANVISSDHDIDEWFKTFYFKNVLYPYFFKRRDDPWGRIWSGFLALKDSDDTIFKTNTLHANISYELLYNNNDNTISNNEIIIPPGWLWKYQSDSDYNVIPFTKNGSNKIENAKTLINIDEPFVFANPFGIRIQKYPFAIGYFNPWINEYTTTTFIDNTLKNKNVKDEALIYHATPIVTQLKRTYNENYYKLSTYINPSISEWLNGEELCEYVRANSIEPTFTSTMWNYFKHPLDLFVPSIPILKLNDEDGYLPFSPENTFLCVKTKNQISDNKWTLSEIWIEDNTDEQSKKIFLPISGEVTAITGDDIIWGENGLCKGYEVYVSGSTDISIYPRLSTDSPIVFNRVQNQNYYELRLASNVNIGKIRKIVVKDAIATSLTKYSENLLTKIGQSYTTVYISVYYDDDTVVQYSISNAANVYMPYSYDSITDNNEYEFTKFNNVGADGIILYADMKPSPESGAIDYYRVPLSLIPNNSPLFYIENKLLPVDQNHMRIVLHAMLNGVETGYIEMQPVTHEKDGSYLFETTMYPLNELIDVDDRIMIASRNNGGGAWIPISSSTNATVNISATNPELKMTILIRSDDPNKDSDFSIGDTYTGFRIVDEYKIDDISLVQELKEMRSVVNFGDSSVPTKEQMDLYNNMMLLCKPIMSTDEGNIKTIIDYALNRIHEYNDEYVITFEQIKVFASQMFNKFSSYIELYKTNVNINVPETLLTIEYTLNNISIDETDTGDDLDWNVIYNNLYDYNNIIKESFKSTGVNNGLEIQLTPFIDYNLMISSKFDSFVSSFTNVHKSIEPVIMKRLEGNNYLDCKLIATYGKPHSYIADIYENLPDDEVLFWPDLNVQIEFDVKLYNQSLATNTLNELKDIIKSYFMHITSLHTAIDANYMDNNIYISHVIQQMEQHSNVAYMKFKGWYTNEKNKPISKYMNATCQGIVRKWNNIDEFPQKELERYVPELFILDNNNIIINIL